MFSRVTVFLPRRVSRIGFLVEVGVNLIILAYKFADHNWNVTPYLWHAYHESARAIPEVNASSESDMRFTLAVVDTDGGKYCVVRTGPLPREFATKFHGAIHEQISRGLPDKKEYGARIDGLYELLIENRVDSMLQARTILWDSTQADPTGAFSRRQEA